MPGIFFIVVTRQQLRKSAPCSPPPPSGAHCVRHTTRRAMFTASAPSGAFSRVRPPGCVSSRSAFSTKRNFFRGRTGIIVPAAGVSTTTRFQSRNTVATAPEVTTIRGFFSGFETHALPRAARVVTRASNWPGLSDADSKPRRGGGGDGESSGGSDDEKDSTDDSEKGHEDETTPGERHVKRGCG